MYRIYSQTEMSKKLGLTGDQLVGTIELDPTSGISGLNLWVHAKICGEYVFNINAYMKNLLAIDLWRAGWEPVNKSGVTHRHQNGGEIAAYNVQKIWEKEGKLPCSRTGRF